MKSGASLPTGKPFATEARMRRADGQYRWFLIRKALAVPPKQGGDSSLRTLIACEDINDRKQAEAKLQQSEIQLQAFFENSPNMIFLKDREGRYLYANREFKRVRHITEEHINGKTDNELFPAEQASVFQASDRQVLEAGVPIEFEQVTVQKTGSIRVLSRSFLSSTQMARSMRSAELSRTLLNVSVKSRPAITSKRAIAWW